MIVKRGRFQGAWNIIRFNWHFYVVVVFAITAIITIGYLAGGVYLQAAFLSAGLITLATLTSIVVSLYIYDLSRLYGLAWMDDLGIGPQTRVANISAGFDETSELIRQRYGTGNIGILDFYDPRKHTEVSIKRARKAYPSPAGTIRIDAGQFSSGMSAAELILLTFAAHEIRNDTEQLQFFGQVHALLEPGGRLIVTEHLRDPVNFIAYNIGFLHFFSRRHWIQLISSAGFTLTREKKLNPFVSSFQFVKG